MRTISHRFLGDRRGSIGLYMAVALLPITLLVGAATDFQRIDSMRARAQDASDAAVLAASKAYVGSGVLGDAQLQAARAAAARALESNLYVEKDGERAPPSGLEDLAWDLAPNQSGELVMTMRARVPLAFAGVLGMEAAPLTVSSASLAGAMKRLEVALVLDNTGSMATDNKIGFLKQATEGLVDQLEAVSRPNPRPDPLKISLVPFSMTVRLDQPAAYRAAGWVTGAPQHASYQGLFADPAQASADRFERLSDWRGCVESRPAPYDVEERAPRSGDTDSLFVPYLNPETADDPNRNCELSPLTRLTGDLGAVRSGVSAMRATGNTNIPMGLAWGWHTLSPEGPFRDGDPYGTPDLVKVLVLMTDGQNNISLHSGGEGAPYTGVGYPRQGRVAGLTPSSTLAERTGALDARLSVLCGNVKERGVVIYTVRVNTPGSPEVMRNCASGADNFFDVKNPRDLPRVFGAIAGRITDLRLSR